MKNIIAILVSLILFFSCSNGFLVNTSRSTNLSPSSTDFKALKNYGYIGGCLLYNGDNPLLGELQTGKSVAFRLGRMSSNSIDNIQKIFTDIPAKAEYGYLTISSIDKNNITISYKIYDFNGNAVRSGSKSLNVGDSADLDGDSIPDIVYQKPAKSRTGLNSSVYLRFICSGDSLTTAMYSIIKDQYANGEYPSGIIGINPDEKFIISKYDSSGSSKSITNGVLKGDYVYDSTTGAFSKTIANISSRAINDSDISSQNIQNLSYSFASTQFSDSQTSIALYNDLPQSVKDIYGSVTDDSTALIYLNNCLSDRSLITKCSTISNMPIPANDLPYVVTEITSLSTADLIKLNRLFLDNAFPNDCPQIDNSSTDITSVLPYLSCVLGDPDLNQLQGNDATSRSLVTKSLTSSSYNTDSSSILSSYSSYSTLKSFDSFTIPNDSKLTVNNSGLKIGYRGSFNITASSVSSHIDVALLLQADTNITITASYSKNLFKYTVPLGNYSIPICGPIILNIVPNLQANIPLNVSCSTSLSNTARLAFIGMYGAGFNASANWGINWSHWWIFSYPHPYFNPSGNGYLISQTAYYCGCDSTRNITFNGASVTLDPNVSLGVNVNITGIIFGDVNAGIGLSNQLGINLNSSSYLVGDYNVSLNEYVTADAGVKLTLPIIGNQEMKWPWTLANASQNLANYQIFSVYI
jgi:hypothetical protein